MKKGISSLIDLITISQPRTQFFYDSWEYCARFYLPEAHVLRKLDHAHIDHTIWVRKQWQNRNVNFGGSWHHRSLPITDLMSRNLHDACDFLLADHTPRKLVIASNYIYVYCNDTDLIGRLAGTGITRLESVTQAKLVGKHGHVMLKNPEHKLRTYLKNRRLDSTVSASVKQFLANQSDIKLSPSLKMWISEKWNWVQSHYFLDHDQESVLLMLKMIDPALIRITLPIEAAK